MSLWLWLFPRSLELACFFIYLRTSIWISVWHSILSIGLICCSFGTRFLKKCSSSLSSFSTVCPIRFAASKSSTSKSPMCLRCWGKGYFFCTGCCRFWAKLFDKWCLKFFFLIWITWRKHCHSCIQNCARMRRWWWWCPGFRFYGRQRRWTERGQFFINNILVRSRGREVSCGRPVGNAGSAAQRRVKFYFSD